MRLVAHELIAHAVQCDAAGCTVVHHVRNERSQPPGFYLQIERVTEGSTRTKNVTPSEIYFCSKECLLAAMKWQLSSFTKKNIPLGTPAWAGVTTKEDPT